MLLLEEPRNKNELLDFFSKDPIINKGLSKDTVTITVNTLRAAGCIISRPTQRTNNKYVLKTYPFTINYTKDHVEALQSLRESIVTLNDWELLLSLNKLYTKLAKFAPDDESKYTLLHQHPLDNVNLGLLKELILFTKIKKHTNISYDSPKNGIEDLDFIPEHITFESAKLYVWGFCKKYNEIAYLRVDKIKRINLVTFSSAPSEIPEIQTPSTYVEYQIKGYSALMYIENKSEIIINSDPKAKYSLTIGANVSNKFNFIQRILSYGTDCKIITPNSFKKEVLDTLRSIKAGYNDEK